jgi:hypothetical protein
MPSRLVSRVVPLIPELQHDPHDVILRQPPIFASYFTYDVCERHDEALPRQAAMRFGRS